MEMIPKPSTYGIKLKPGEAHTFMSYMPFVLSNAYCIAQLESRKDAYDIQEQENEYIRDQQKAKLDKEAKAQKDESDIDSDTKIDIETALADIDKSAPEISKKVSWTIHDRIELYSLNRVQAQLLDELRVWWNENYAYCQFLCTDRAYKPMDTSDTGIDTVS